MNDQIFKYILSIVLGICGWLITMSYNRLNGNIERLNLDLVDMKIQITDIRNQMMDEAKIKEIVETELLRHGIK